MEFLNSFNIELSPFTLLSTPEGLVRVDKLSNGQLMLGGTSEEQKLTNLLGGKKEPTYQLTLKNGNSLIVQGQVQVYTQEGWKSISDLAPNEMILNYYQPIVPRSSGEKLIGYKNKDQGNYMPIFIPEKMSESFAEWLGIMTLGSVNSSNGAVGIYTDQEVVAERFIALTKEVLNVTPEKTQDKREGAKPFYYFVSKNVVEFLKIYLGPTYHLRKIPAFLLEGSIGEQVSFLRGLSAYAYAERNNLVMYSGTSKPISEFASLILRNCGYEIDLIAHKIPDDDLKMFYYVKILGRHPKGLSIELINQEFQGLINKTPSYMVLNEQLSSLKIKSYHPKYEIFKKIKNNPLVKAKHILEFGLELSGYFFEPIKEIKFLGDKDLVALKVLYPRGLSVNQIILGGKV